MYYLNLDENGYLLSVFRTAESPENVPGVESLEGLDLTGCRIRAHRWDGEKLTLNEDRLAELLLAEEAAAEDRPTPLEQLRADVDFLAAMQGVSL